MPLEKYIAITPDASAEWIEVVHFQALRDDEEGFRIVVSHGKAGNRYLIRFGSVVAYRNCDECKRLKTLGEVTLSGFGLYKVENSEFAEWFKDQCIYSSDIGLTVFAIATTDDWIEVIAYGTPEVVHAWKPEENA